MELTGRGRGELIERGSGIQTPVIHELSIRFDFGYKYIRIFKNAKKTSENLSNRYLKISLV